MSQPDRQRASGLKGASAAKGRAELAADVLERARAGEPEACRALVERYQRPVFAVLSRILASGHRQDMVEDLAQETFLRVFGALGRFDPSGPARLSTWILTIATRLALDVLRRRTVEVPAHEDKIIAMPGRQRADQLAQRRSLGRAIERAVGQLKPEFRAVFVLRMYHELSYLEIAQILDCDLGTVKSRLSRAKAALRQSLEAVR